MPSAIAGDFLGQPVWAWVAFLTIFIILLAVDLGLFHRKDREIPVRESFALSAGYIAVALLFGVWIWWWLGEHAAIDYLTGYLVEKSLSLDNVFVISLIFGALAVPPHLQHRVLFYGVLGVVVMRALVIGLGAATVMQFDWILFAVGAFLVLTGIRMMAGGGNPAVILSARMSRTLQRMLPLTDGLRGRAFLVREPDPATGRIGWRGTPLLIALILVEFTDAVFAIDSVPAILAITTDPYLIYTSNIFAVLGLRALYFALAASIHRLHYLKYALALVLVFIGSKIFINRIFGKLDPLISLAAVVTILAVGILLSLWKTRSGRSAVVAGRQGDRG